MSSKRKIQVLLSDSINAIPQRPIIVVSICPWVPRSKATAEWSRSDLSDMHALETDKNFNLIVFDKKMSMEYGRLILRKQREGLAASERPYLGLSDEERRLDAAKRQAINHRKIYPAGLYNRPAIYRAADLPPCTPPLSIEITGKVRRTVLTRYVNSASKSGTTNQNVAEYYCLALAQIMGLSEINAVEVMQCTGIKASALTYIHVLGTLCYLCDTQELRSEGKNVDFFINLAEQLSKEILEGTSSFSPEWQTLGSAQFHHELKKGVNEEDYWKDLSVFFHERSQTSESSWLSEFLPAVEYWLIDIFF